MQTRFPSFWKKNLQKWGKATDGVGAVGSWWQCVPKLGIRGGAINPLPNTCWSFPLVLWYKTKLEPYQLFSVQPLLQRTPSIHVFSLTHEESWEKKHEKRGIFWNSTPGCFLSSVLWEDGLRIYGWGVGGGTFNTGSTLSPDAQGGDKTPQCKPSSHCHPFHSQPPY